MAKKNKTDEQPETVAVSDADKARACKWFEKAADCRERREYDYAIECFITGLGYWPNAVEEGHMPLRSLAIQRQQIGGKKPGLMDGIKRSMTGKDSLKGMLNAERLLSMDPHNGSYAEGVLKNANNAGWLETVKWIAPIVMEALRRDKKPSKARFMTFRDAMVEAGEQANTAGDNALETWVLEQAVNSVEYVLSRSPGDDELKNEHRDLAGKLTICRGKYDEAGDFRESLRDAETQKLLHDADRTQQAEQTLDALIAAARQAWEESPDEPAKITRLVGVLTKAERDDHEAEARKVLMGAYERAGNYSFKQRADEIRLRQLKRAARKWMAQARQSGSDEDKQQARLAVMEQLQVALDVYRERVAQYPTDLGLKFRLGEVLFQAQEYDEAIPVLQVAQADPRHRFQCQLFIGRAFLEKENATQAAEVLREALNKYELTDENSKQLLYWLGRAAEADEDLEEAKAVYGKLLRQDYNYMNGDARKRLDELK